MVTITVLNDNKQMVGFTVVGHSSYDVHGSDIVCAAVSALSQTAIPALSKVLELSPEWFRNDGILSCRLPDQLNKDQIERAQIVFQTIIVGLEIIARQYPKYTRILNKEV